MLDILAITGPIFAIIAVGYAAVRLGLFSRGELRVLAKFVIHFALPALLFKALSERSFAEVMNTEYLLAYALGSIAVMAAGIGMSFLGRGRSLQDGAINGLGMSVSNSGFIGYPVVLQFLGPAAAVALALTMMVENMLLIPLALCLAEAGARHGKGHTMRAVVLASFSRLLRNPVILAILAGFACAMLGLRAPAPVGRVIELFAAASAAGALFVIGGMLVGVRAGNMAGDIARVGLGKLMLHPLAVFGAFTLVTPIDPVLHMAAVTYACMPMLSIYPILAQQYQREEICAATLVATTVASFASISVALWLIRGGMAI